MEIRETPTAEAAMLIRRPVADVFEAIVDPAITTQFWFTHGSGRLDGGKPVQWEWRMYGVSTTVDVSEIVRDKKIVMTWSDPPTTVVWTFTEMPGEATFLEVRNFGFTGHGDEQVKEAVGSTGGFTLVLAGAKAWLEQGLTLSLIGDRHPKGVPAG
ncbi:MULTISPECIES: SRPBCC family protein [unclassified Mesorhizobium]|uniref:SRPBCC family protein n=1 Tax=unclassified Mesorhizobium TaxID=325217 RepID=UPI000FEA3766|nr:MULTISPECIES: SRPBCC family protein [unclassified Mesorhizobium]TGV52120.1 polyketide cyclase [bacterium M00.F.Ca.ET.141.01.1.1]RWF41057.1 MAG: polyketide cyclase [Mesorhizobium sp.]TGP98346.1 polyketide cyclase [Mesorhizobium sp. M8A.F.Ca.ET.218.01.1.1]TGT19691.1 polyketide cyclase [Mesorhizobium sp. M8A.F.Ca.ET.213.01.1.1]TGT36876.1 polyketide cyclase [Mesorhizobium sp. M8A.F.Ca.ET.165.01.1.1]